MFCLTCYKKSLQSTKFTITSSGTLILRKTPHREHENAIHFPLILPTGTVCPFVPGTFQPFKGLGTDYPSPQIARGTQQWGEISKSPPYTLQAVKGKNTGLWEHSVYLC